MEFATRQKQQNRRSRQGDLKVVAVEFSPSTPGAENGLGKVFDLLFSPQLHEDDGKILRGEE